MEPKLRKESLEALLVDCLRARAAHQPVLLVLEDAHWLGALSHDLLEVVSRAIPDDPVTILITLRPPELERLQAPRISRLPHYTEVALDGLPMEEATALVRARLGEGSDPLPPAAWVAEVVAQAGGNPFYLEELVAYVREQGGGALWALEDTTARSRITWPVSLQSLLLARIDLVKEEERMVLKVASIVGQRFPVVHLWGVYPPLGEEAQVIADLDDLATLDLTPSTRPRRSAPTASSTP